MSTVTESGPLSISELNVSVRLTRRLNQENIQDLSQAAARGKAFWAQRMRKVLLDELSELLEENKLSFNA